MKKQIAYLCIIAMLAASLSACSIVQDIQGKLGFSSESTPAETLPPQQNNAVTPTTAETSGITFDTYMMILSVGDSALLGVRTNDQTGLKWRSSNENVALVNSLGSVTAVGEGVTNISCTNKSGAEAVCTVTVTAAAATQPTTPVVKSLDVFPHSSTTYLLEEEIAYRLDEFNGESPTGSYIQDAINEIYARHGYPFQTASIRAFYEKQGWYAVNDNFSTGDLNAYEKANLALLNEWLN